jgi:hypothetical protein
LGLVIGATAAVAEREAWEVVLAAQLESERGCKLAKVLDARDFELGGKQGKSGKIECLDGRQFDFTRPSQQVKFEIRQCEPTVC